LAQGGKQLLKLRGRRRKILSPAEFLEAVKEKI
jgi:predicted nucleic acid-binding protein